MRIYWSAVILIYRFTTSEINDREYIYRQRTPREQAGLGDSGSKPSWRQSHINPNE
jgi:hypothetical protein